MKSRPAGEKNTTARRKIEIQRLAKALHLSPEILCEMLAGARRRRAKGKAGAPDKQRLAKSLERLDALYMRALDILGSRANVARWFQSPIPSLGSKTPLECCRTDRSARAVAHLLGRIEHGVVA